MNPFDFYVANEYWFAAVQLALAMIGMGATLTPGDFANVARDPKGFSVGALMQVLMVPLVCYAFIHSLPVTAGVAIGLALCAAVPGGTVSNIFTLMARGHVALSIALTAIITIACLVTVPIVLKLLVSEHLPAEVTLPARQIATEIALILLLPLGVGMVLLNRLPKLAPLISKWCIRASLFTIALIVIGALGAGRLDLEAFGPVNALTVIAFIAMLCVVSFLLPRLMGLSLADTAAINIEVSMRNANLAVMIKASQFPAVVGVADPLADTVFFTILLFGSGSLIASLGLVSLYRRIGTA